MTKATSSFSWRHALPLGAAALLIGCGPGGSGSQSGDEGTPRGETGSILPPASPEDDSGRVAGGPDVDTAPARSGRGFADDSSRLIARAQLQPLNGSSVRGTVEFNQEAEGLAINIALMGLEPGEHGFHVHENGDCTSPGEHLNPDNAPHGAPQEAAAARHRGDLGNVMADASGTVDETIRDAVLPTDDSYIGRALIVHAGKDDLSSQPSGESGDPVACGVIESTALGDLPQNNASGAGRPGV